MSRVFSFLVSVLIGVLCGSVSADSIPEARDLVARAKTLRLEASGAFEQGDLEQWAAKLDESRRMVRVASRMYRAAGVLDGDDVELAAEYAKAVGVSGDVDLRAEGYRRCVVLEPGQAKWHLGLGKALLKMGVAYHAEAKRSLDRTLEMAPDSEEGMEAAAALGELYWQLGHYDLAEEYCERAYLGGRDGVMLMGTLAALYARQGKFVEAERLLSGLQGFRGGQDAAMRERLEQGVEDFSARRARFGDTFENHAAYARLLVRAGQFEHAALSLKRAATLAPDEVWVLNMLGSVLERSGDIGAARMAYEKSLRVNPDQPRTRKALEGLESPSR